jgi:hypothetical protein
VWLLLLRAGCHVSNVAEQRYFEGHRAGGRRPAASARPLAEAYAPCSWYLTADSQSGAYWPYRDLIIILEFDDPGEMVLS